MVSCGIALPNASVTSDSVARPVWSGQHQSQVESKFDLFVDALEGVGREFVEAVHLRRFCGGGDALSPANFRRLLLLPVLVDGNTRSDGELVVNRAGFLTGGRQRKSSAPAGVRSLRIARMVVVSALISSIRTLRVRYSAFSFFNFDASAT